MLTQEEHAVAYFSRALRCAESRYNTVELECLAIIESLKRFRHYLLGGSFNILTDHKPLDWLSSQKSIGKLWRCATIIREFDFVIQYRPRNGNGNADSLSRVVKQNLESNDFRDNTDSAIKSRFKDRVVLTELVTYVAELRRSPVSSSW